MWGAIVSIDPETEIPALLIEGTLFVDIPTEVA